MIARRPGRGTPRRLPRSAPRRLSRAASPPLSSAVIRRSALARLLGAGLALLLLPLAAAGLEVTAEPCPSALPSSSGSRC